MRDPRDTLTGELPGLTPAPRRVRAGMIVQCDGMTCRVATVMRGGHLVEVRTFLGDYIGVRPVEQLVFGASPR